MKTMKALIYGSILFAAAFDVSQSAASNPPKQSVNPQNVETVNRIISRKLLTGGELAFYWDDHNGAGKRAHEIPSDATVGDLRAVIGNLTHFPYFTMSLGGAALNDDAISVADAGLQAEAMIDVAVRVPVARLPDTTALYQWLINPGNKGFAPEPYRYKINMAKGGKVLVFPDRDFGRYPRKSGFVVENGKLFQIQMNGEKNVVEPWDGEYAYIAFCKFPSDMDLEVNLYAWTETESGFGGQPSYVPVGDMEVGSFDFEVVDSSS